MRTKDPQDQNSKSKLERAYEIFHLALCAFFVLAILSSLKMIFTYALDQDYWRALFHLITFCFSLYALNHSLKELDKK